jgi:hypothetical protein
MGSDGGFITAISPTPSRLNDKTGETVKAAFDTVKGL